MEVEELYTIDAHEEGAEMQVKDATGNLIDCYIILSGVDSKSWRAAKNKYQRDIVRGSDITDASAEALASITLSWKGFKNKGKTIPFSKAKVKQLYTKAPYIMDQADTFIADRSNFTKG